MVLFISKAIVIIAMPADVDSAIFVKIKSIFVGRSSLHFTHSKNVTKHFLLRLIIFYFSVCGMD